LKVVFDTNIYISAFVIPGGNAERAYLRALNGDFELYTSIAILTELARKLEEKFGWDKQKITQLLKHISKTADVLKTSQVIKVLADDPDNRILECAVESKAELILTGDKHLLKIRHYQDSKIIKLSDFLMMFDGKIAKL
jgi:putative PIN family toxin of toxin-antitoxin system